MKLTKGRKDVLEKLWRTRDTEEGELTQSVPGGWWLGNEQVSGAIGYWLLRNSLIQVTYSDAGGGRLGTYTVYKAAPDIGWLLRDPAYIPEGVLVFRRFAQRSLGG